MVLKHAVAPLIWLYFVMSTAIPARSDRQFLEYVDGKLVINQHHGQVQAWNSQKRFILILAGTRGGKALSIDTPIPTPTGFVPIGDLVRGDQVFDKHGKVCNVIETFPIQHDRQCYRVTFDDGASVIADAEHLWEVRGLDLHWSVLTTAQIRSNLVVDGKLNYSVGIDLGEKPPLKLRFVASIEPVESVPVRCIAVDSPSRTYLCGKDYIPTHNTSFSQTWLWREMKQKGPGDYLYCAPTFKLLDKAAVPYLKELFTTYLGLGEVKGGSAGCFEVSEQGHWKLWGKKRRKNDQPSRIIFGHADDPNSLEAAKYKAAVCDEAGQVKFKQESWEAIQRRLAIDMGRCLFPTTPYAHTWLKHDVYDRAMRVRTAKAQNLPFDKFDDDYDVVSFESIQNPAFPLEEWERAKASLPRWKFDMFYRGMFTRPAGAIYDCYVDDYPEQDRPGHLRPGKDFNLPPNVPIYCGIDFGAPNFAAVFLFPEAQLDQHGKPAGNGLTVYAEYVPKESRTAAQHIEAMKRITKGRLPNLCVGGAMSEGQWRSEFSAGGWPIREPDQRDVEVGIARTYAAFAEMSLFVMDTCEELRDELNTYSREVTDDGEPISDTIMDKNDFHTNDSLRYIVSYLRRTSMSFHVGGI